ncbi:MAG TPA: hypothetical protein VGQ17_12650 [Gemmatimonadales bacterium]|nr:hypothetical protein [Gemmatimonadales bacterium]
MNGESGAANQRRAPVNALVGPTLALLAVALVAPPLAARQAPDPGGWRVPDLRVKGKKSPCEVHPETAAETAELWMIAREALEGSKRTEPGAPTLLVVKWRRRLGPRLDLRSERRDTSRLTTLHPFETEVPYNLESEGYIQRRAWLMIFYGPDPGFLLSERFLRQHCFRRIAGEGANAGLVGLGFDPLPRQNASDVSGVLWIDLAGDALHRVEYAWTSPPREADAPGVGGFSVFARLASGGWILRQWNMRLPRFEASGFGYDLVGYTDEGGEVLAVGKSRPTRR